MSTSRANYAFSLCYVRKNPESVYLQGRLSNTSEWGTSFSCS